MSTAVPELPRIRPDLVIRRTGEGEYVVKCPADGSYFRLGEVEHFLLTQLDGQQSARSVRKEYEARFGERLGSSGLNEFLDAIKPLGLLDLSESEQKLLQSTSSSNGTDDDEDSETGKRGRGSILFFRRSLFNPDRLLNAMEPQLQFVWTRGFVIVTALMMFAALLVVWNSRHELVTTFSGGFRWEMVALVWLTLVVATMLHEFAHGLTCKHYGGEVREIGVLFALFTPCFYCNVTDAWLIPKKSHRLWVTLAGGYCDLCLWALAVFVWRLTVQDSLVNYVAWVILTVCGGRLFINLNPLLRMDGYYLLSDWLEIPNLRKRATDYWMQHVRWLLWGADRPPPVERGPALLVYGMLIWVFALVFLDLVFLGLVQFVSGQLGLLGLSFMLLLLFIALKRVFRGFFGGEFRKMITTRPQRTATWALGTLGVLALLFLVPLPYVVNGNFEVRPGTRTEVHAPVSGFLRLVHREEGDRVTPDETIVELDVPDLASHLKRKRAEVQEVEATLRRLRTGPRPEEVAEQRQRVKRSEGWSDLAQKDLERSRLSLQQDFIRLDQQVLQSDTELKYAVNSVNQAAKLYKLGALAGEQYRSEYKRYELSASQLAEAQATKKAREAEGVRAAEAELARREKELEDTRATLSLLEAGSRPEDIEAETARRTRLLEELKYLEDQKGKLQVRSVAAGVIATPRLKDRIGQLAEVGSLICVVEDLAVLRVEILIPEEDVAGLQPGQSIELKARALPFDTFEAKVERIAPSALITPDKRQSTITVYCDVANQGEKMKSGMTGMARVYRGYRPFGIILVHKALRYLRTEFWW
ncbi:MAG: efflux RND transporter periplasmic adaptor subunit [Planctomycetota bacterium]